MRDLLIKINRKIKTIERRITMFGIALIVLGVIFLLQNLGFISTASWSIIWPALFILTGLYVIGKGKKF